MEAEEVLPGEKQILARSGVCSSNVPRTHKIQIHGDFHLGQALHTGRDFIFLHLEGEPPYSSASEN